MQMRLLRRFSSTFVCIHVLALVVILIIPLHSAIVLCRAETELETELELDFIADFGGIPNNSSAVVCAHNSDRLRAALNPRNWSSSSSLSLRLLRLPCCTRQQQCCSSNHSNSNFKLIIQPRNVTFSLYHGIVATGLSNVTLQLDATLQFERQRIVPISNDTDDDDDDDDSSSSQFHPSITTYPSIWIRNSTNFTITSQQSMDETRDSTRGVFNGQGSQYWGDPMRRQRRSQSDLRNHDHDPRGPVLLHLEHVNHATIEHIVLQDSPSQTLRLESVQQIVVRHVSIVNRRTPQDGHSLIDLSAVDTVGVDIRGGYYNNINHSSSRNVHIHDVDIWTQSDCIRIQAEALSSCDSSVTTEEGNIKNNDTGNDDHDQLSINNILIENVNASGFGGVTITAAATGCSAWIDNIVVRNWYVHKPVHGMYIQFMDRDRTVEAEQSQNASSSSSTALISNVHIEHVVMVEPIQWSLWLGPAQSTSSSSLSFASSIESLPPHIHHPTETGMEAEMDVCSETPTPTQTTTCSVCWPSASSSTCRAVTHTSLVNVTLFNVTLIDPRQSPGVLLGDPQQDAMIENVVLDRVQVKVTPAPWFAPRRTSTNDTPNNNTNHSNAKQPQHPFSCNLTETFPGLLRPIHDAYVPTDFDWSRFSSDADRPLSDDSEASEETQKAAQSQYQSPKLFLYLFLREYIGAMTIMVIVCAAVVVIFSPWVWTVMVATTTGKRIRHNESNRTIDSIASSTSSSSSTSDYASAIFSLTTEPLPSSLIETTSSDTPIYKRVRFASADDETPLSSPLLNNNERARIDPPSVDNNGTHSMIAPLLEPAVSGNSTLSSASGLVRLTTASTAGQRVSVSFHWTYGHWVASLVMLTMTGLSAWCWKWYTLHYPPVLIPEWQRIDRYYTCEGIINGIAKGGTWPVPYCFDQRVASQWWVWIRHLHGVALWIGVGCVGAVISISALALLMWRCCRGRDLYLSGAVYWRDLANDR